MGVRADTVLDTPRLLRGHLLLVPLAVDLGLGSPVLDRESRSVPWCTRLTEGLATIGPRGLS